MSEYIERERLKEAFIADLQKLQTLDEHTMDLILIEIEEAPAADVAEVRHGRWIELNIENSTGPILKCSECSHIHNPNRNDLDLERVELKPLYCDACSARMDKEAENEKLRDKIEDARLEGYAKGIGEMCAELERVKQELDELKSPEVLEAVDELMEFARTRMSTGNWLYYVEILGKWYKQKDK